MTGTRKHILDTAFSLFLSKSYKAVTMSELERATGLTKGAFYHYFKSKEEIFVEIVNSVFQKQAFVIAEMAKATTLKEFIHIYLGLLEKDADEMKKIMCQCDGRQEADPMLLPLMLEAKQNYPMFDDNMIQMVQRRQNVWERIVVKAKEDGEIRPDLDASILAESFIALSSGFVKVMFVKRSVDEIFNIVRLQYDQLYRLVKS